MCLNTHVNHVQRVPLIERLGSCRPDWGSEQCYEDHPQGRLDEFKFLTTQQTICMIIRNIIFTMHLEDYNDFKNVRVVQPAWIIFSATPSDRRQVRVLCQLSAISEVS